MANLNDLKIHAYKNPGDIESMWRKLQEIGTSCIYQDYDWVCIAYHTLEKHHSPLIIVGETDDGPQFILPLIVEEGIISVVRWPGNTHANICNGIFSHEYLGSGTAEHTKLIVAEIRKHVTGLSMLHLPNQLGTIAGQPNPLLTLPHQPSVNIMYDMDLTPGMDAILDAGNGKRKRKLFRKQVRVAQEMGGYELVVPETEDEIRICLDDFYKQKTQRFDQMGVRDVFAPKETREFLHALATAPEVNGVKPLMFFELKVGGKTRALYACAGYRDYCQAWVNSVTYDDFSSMSPGEMVLYIMIEKLIEDGYKHFDLGVGTERYKKSWCKSSTTLMDVFMPLSAATIPFVAAKKAKTAIKSKLRNSDTLWPKIKKLRKKIIGKS